ncbi:hypothetical protein HOLleu_19974 [Holothuria leucospilota]|uniref:Uncharacterized protein n=1 Tax=Holothuria leucospilota TaxID=206669 RepID=A0A9Q1H7M3_HOLLE|nr:hypothetical protein HOLleu_19974 [Holothuria leucospilota]
MAPGIPIVIGRDGKTVAAQFVNWIGSVRPLCPRCRKSLHVKAYSTGMLGVVPDKFKQKT